MLDRIDEWRARLQGRPAAGARSEPEAERRPEEPEAPDAPGGAARRLEDYGPCASCGGGREVVMRPMGGDAARLGLVCTECGTSTGI